jgi:acetyltransferase-like isoleucine patch superfamily enzyme
VGSSIAEINQKAVAAMQRGDPSTAIVLLEEAITLDGSNPTLLNNLAVVLIQTKNIEEAFKVLARAYQVTPGDRTVALNLARVAEALGQIEVAHSVSRDSLHRFPGDPEFLGIIGGGGAAVNAISEQHKTQLSGSWAAQAAYVAVGRNVILGSGSSVDIRFRPESPGVRVVVGDESQIFGACTVLRPCAHISLGARTQFGASRILAAESVEIGDDVLMAWNITIVDSDLRSFDWEERRADIARGAQTLYSHPHDLDRGRNWERVGIAPVRIENRAWIGFNVVICKGVTIGEGAIIGAGSVVTESVPPYCLAAGNQAKVIRQLPVALDARSVAGG